MLQLLLILISSCHEGHDIKMISKKDEHSIGIEINQRLKNKAAEIKTFNTNHPIFNNDFIFLIDMRIPSMQNRFFVYNLASGKVVDKGLVAHGYGSEIEGSERLRFSNIEGSNCSAIGKYKVGNSYLGRFGLAYKLHGLDSTNSNSFKRNIVLHRYWRVPEEEQTDPIYNSLGCPMVSENFFLRLEKIIGNATKPTLLYMYY